MKKKTVFSLLWLVLCSIGVSGCSLDLCKDQSKDSLVADMYNGHFVGEESNDTGINSWKGIPYAQSAKDYRWQRAKDVLKSDETYDAKEYGDSCIQYAWYSEISEDTPISEDCLSLNIWSNTSNKTKNKPVMVFFHGGGFAWGSSNEEIYNGEYFVKENPDIILVTANYRVGAMGFMDLSSIPDGKTYTSSMFEDAKNLGLLDQIQALRYIKQNIASIGGDPENIIIFGESAGAVSVQALCTMDEAIGLFQHCIAQSGGLSITYSEDDVKERALAERVMSVTGAKDLDDLMSISTEDWIHYYTEVEDKDGLTLNDYYNLPIRDGKNLEEDLYSAFSEKAKNVDFMVGSNANEWNYWIGEQQVGSYKENYDSYVENVVSPFKESLENELTEEDKELYSKYMKLPTVANKDDVMAFTEFMNDAVFRVPSLECAEAHSTLGGSGSTYVYYNDIKSTLRGYGGLSCV